MSVCRIVLLGSGCSAKSCFVVRLVKEYFPEEYDPTVEDQYRMQRVIDGRPYIADILGLLLSFSTYFACSKMFVC